MQTLSVNWYFRRDAEDSDWIRILTLLGLSADLYNDLTQENINNNCPSKLICQAFESRDFLGFTFWRFFYDPILTNGHHFRPRGVLHQKNLPTLHVSSVPNWWWLKWQQTNRKNLSLWLLLIISCNVSQEENSTCSSKYLECEMSLISSLQKLQGERNNF